MKKFSTFALMMVSSATFAFDQYLPVAKGKLEVDAEYQYQGTTGVYLRDHRFVEIDGSPAVSAQALQLKYGILDGLDVEVLGHYDVFNKDHGDVQGFGSPELALKYVDAKLGLGGFVNVVLPTGSEDVVGKEPATTIVPGVIFGKTFGQTVINAFANYQYNLEVNKSKQDFAEAYLQCQLNVTKNIGPYMGVDVVKSGEVETDGVYGDGTSGYLLAFRPGMNLVANDQFSAELTFPVTILGKNAEAGWGIYAGVYYTIGL